MELLRELIEINSSKQERIDEAYNIFRPAFDAYQSLQHREDETSAEVQALRKIYKKLGFEAPARKQVFMVDVQADPKLAKYVLTNFEFDNPVAIIDHLLQGKTLPAQMVKNFKKFMTSPFSAWLSVMGKMVLVLDNGQFKIYWSS